MRTLRTYITLLLMITLAGVLSGCANKNAPTQEDLERQGEKYEGLSRSRAFGVTDGPYLGARIKSLDGDETSLNARITLRKKGTLLSMASSIHELTALAVHISDADPDTLMRPAAPTAAPSASPDAAGLGLPDFPGGLGGLGGLGLPSGSGPAKALAVNYEGPLRGLLDQLATQSGYGWDFDARSNTIVFARVMTRTFTLLAAPGKTTYDNQITNKSKESTSGNRLGSSRGVNQSVSSADTSAQTTQTNRNQFNFDVYADTEKVIKTLLSPKGTVAGNPVAGTITVRDRPENVRQVSAFVRDVNMRVSRQVALKVQVWALEVVDDKEAGLDLQVMFQNEDIAVVAGSLAATGGLNTASATIVSGKLKDSTAVLKALKQWGNATQITSGGGLAMSNQPLPVMAIKRHAYLAGASAVQSDYGLTTEITPGEVTSGFSMTVIPHILDRRRCILQYNINLSSLDEMVEFKTSDITVQLPQVSTRAFTQRTTMQMGQTLVLAGFQQQTQTIDNKIGVLSTGRKAGYGKTLLVITIELESAGSGMEACGPANLSTSAGA